jgi:hypothetical protein
LNDPHVEALHYRLVVDGTTSFAENVPPVEYADETLTARLAGGQLTVRPKEHCASELEALLRAHPFIRAWEISSALTYRRPEVRFEYQWAEIVDRTPPPPGNRTVTVSAAVAAAAAIGATLSVERGSYPAPPRDFAYDADVDTLYHRWVAFLNGAEPLPSMANFCLTVLEHVAGGRGAAAAHFRISGSVLSKVGKLATERGDALTARKMSSNLQPLKPEESEWLEAAVRVMIRRAGEVAAQPGQPLPQITLADLPRLT